jgi:GH25 family lysozyme M1 (1,4-beta-N-acetylmuramidase)
VLAAVVAQNWPELSKRMAPTPPPSQTAATADAAPKATPGLLPGANPAGFLNDSGFFDVSAEGEAGFLVTYGKTANLVLSSVEKDLRIHIVDILGRNIAGEEFSVLVDGVEYRDSDMDGIIYIRPLPAGECKVTLKPRPGFRTQAEPSAINIKQQIEYVAMSVLDLKILTESQIDVSADEASGKMADDDRGANEYTEPLGSWGGAKFGIDVSKWNKEIDWQQVKEAGAEFAIIRVGYRGRTSGSLVEDPYFRANIRGAIAAEIPVGVYFFTQAITILEAVEEASMVISMVADYQLDYPIFIDSEGSGAGGLGRADGLAKEQRTDITRAFLETARSAGYNVGVYAARNWLHDQLDTERLSEYIVWLAEYRDIPLYTGYYQMWQYSSRGRLAGIEGYVDMNLSYLN